MIYTYLNLQKHTIISNNLIRAGELIVQFSHKARKYCEGMAELLQNFPVAI